MASEILQFIRKHDLAIIALLVTSIFVAGSFITTYANPYSYDADIQGGKVRIDSTAATEYTVVQYDLDSDPASKEVYLYCDPAYKDANTNGSQTAFEKNLKVYLARDNVDNYKGHVSAEGFGDIAENNADAAVIVYSGSLPDTVVSTSGDASKLIAWLNAGGTLIWAWGAFGSSVSTTDGCVEVDYAEDVFGPMEYAMVDKYSGDITELGDAFSFRAHYMGCCLPSDLVTANNPYGCLGHTLDGYSNINSLRIGNGHMVTVGSDYTPMSVSRLVASGAYMISDMVHIDKGTMKGACTIDVHPTVKYAYVYLGSKLSIYSELLKVD